MRAQCGFAGLSVRAHVNMPLFYAYQVTLTLIPTLTLNLSFTLPRPRTLTLTPTLTPTPTLIQALTLLRLPGLDAGHVHGVRGLL